MLESSIRPDAISPMRADRAAAWWVLMISSRSREKLPSSVAVEPRASAEAMDSDNNRPGCAKAGRTIATARASDSMMTSAPAGTRAIAVRGEDAACGLGFPRCESLPSPAMIPFEGLFH